MCKNYNTMSFGCPKSSFIDFLCTLFHITDPIPEQEGMSVRYSLMIKKNEPLHISKSIIHETCVGSSICTSGI